MPCGKAIPAPRRGTVARKAMTAIAPQPAPPAGDGQIEVTVVIPCLDEVRSIGTCVDKALRGLEAAGVRGEVVVSDNGSTDGSVEEALAHGARVVHAARRGYGNALKDGIEAARGAFIVMGDADDSYDFLELPKFVEKLRDGYDLAQGCRLPSGGGRIEPGAMPALHRWWGNPMLSAMLRRMFWSRVHDVYCGLRGFRKAIQAIVARYDLRPARFQRVADGKPRSAEPEHGNGLAREGRDGDQAITSASGSRGRRARASPR